MKHPQHPFLYQIHTRILLRELSKKFRRTARLKDIPNSILDQIANRGFNFVWMLGIWQTGEVGAEIARHHEGLRPGLEEALPDLTENDIVSSPFAVQRYVPHEAFGGEPSLKRLRDRLAQRQIKLMLDFVPNHTAPDHVWAHVHPEFYIQGTEEDITREPGNYTRLETYHGSKIFANGKDPYFPAWTDTLQLNYRHAGMREAMIRMLLRIAEQCDGVRCDMAMLVLPDVIQRTWGERSLPVDGSQPVDTPFWPEAIARVREKHPDFTFMAEVYWDLEWELQQQGFDYTYDKRLYDRLREKHPETIRQHLNADLGFQKKLVRFLENHDEPRAAKTFPWDQHQAAAVLTYSLPGMRFFYEGQFEGRESRVPMQLARRRDEKPKPEVQDFYEKLLTAVLGQQVRVGNWQQLQTETTLGENPFLAFLWELTEANPVLVVVNYGDAPGWVTVRFSIESLRGQQVPVRDLLSSLRLDKSGDDLVQNGLVLEMPAWGHHIFELGEEPPAPEPEPEKQAKSESAEAEAEQPVAAAEGEG